MTKISVIAPTGEKVEAELVRFFEAYGKKYLVYTLNEKDEQGYVKLYVARIDNDADGDSSGEFIEYNDEWNNVKTEFKKIITSNGAGVNDLNPAEIANIGIKGHRIIKLLQTNVESLSANQKQFEPAPAPAAPVEPTFEMETPTPAPAAPVQPDFGFDAPAQPSFAPAPAPDFGMEQPVQPAAPAAPTPADYGFDAPAPFPTETPAYQTPVATMAQSAAPESNNYEQMYNDLKVKFDRCSAELEKVTNENIDLRIKIDDIREILEED